MSIKDKVAIVGVGCSKFGENYDKSAEDMIVEATYEAYADAGVELPVNPSGGLKSFGHPIGATGVRMLYEVTLHLQNRAGQRQIPGAELGLAHNLGGPGSIGCVTILGNN